jgi:hypothetical protein
MLEMAGVGGVRVLNGPLKELMERAGVDAEARWPSG